MHIGLAFVHVQVTVTVFKVGDIVKVTGDKTDVEDLQNIFGLWDDTLIKVKDGKL